MFNANPFEALEDDSNKTIFDKDDCLEQHKNEMNEKYDLFLIHVSSREFLTKSTIYKFITIISECYFKINQTISFLEEEGLDTDPQLVFDLDKETNRFYRLMDQKYQTCICTEEALNIFNQNDFLLDVDVYYNFWAVSKNKCYIDFILNQSSIEMLKIVDIIYFKDDNVNRKSREKIYKEILDF